MSFMYLLTHQIAIYLRYAGKKVYVFSSKNNVSEELRTGTDGYTDVLLINKDIWGRELRRREENRVTQ